MSSFKIATWNVNSLRVRLPHVLTWLADCKPDVLALQETKLQDVDFPFAELQEAGYHVIASGQRTYNGVALLSREKPQQVMTEIPDLEDPQKRVLCATIGDVRVLNLYVPNGESVVSEKYQYKLRWLQHLDRFLQMEIAGHPKMVIVGDFNIAPADIDIHDPISWAGHVLCSEPERQAFQQLLQKGFHDCFRTLSPEEKSYSWWDYRMNAFKRKMGWRIDHILASQALLADCKRCYIDPIPRGWERPSDHAPVIAEFINQGEENE